MRSASSEESTNRKIPRPSQNSMMSGSEKIQEKIAKTRASFFMAFTAITRPNSRAKRNFMHSFVSFPAKQRKAQRRNRRKDQWRKRRRTEQRTKRRRTDQRRRTELWHLHHLNETNLSRQKYRVFHANLDIRKRCHSASKNAKIVLKKDSKST